jgi:hypothetical protein
VAGALRRCHGSGPDSDGGSDQGELTDAQDHPGCLHEK